jgi:hypothetical protein
MPGGLGFDKSIINSVTLLKNNASFQPISKPRTYELKRIFFQSAR